MQSSKAMEIDYPFVSGHSKYDTHQIKVHLNGFGYRFYVTHFSYPDNFHEYTKLHENVAQYFS
jgi:hypothetical protein